MSALEPAHLIMPHYNGKYDIIRAFYSIIERTCYPYFLTIIDDGSSEDDDGYAFLRYLQNNTTLTDKDLFCKGINIIFNEKNVGVTPNLNKGMLEMYNTLDVVRLDADIEIQSKYWLNEIVNYANKHNNVGVVAPLGVCSDYVTIASAGQWLIIDKEDFDNNVFHSFSTEIFDKMNQSRYNLPDKAFEVDSVLGCCCLYKREVINKLGGVDEKYFGWVEDNDFCLGARNLGYKVVIVPSVSYCHHAHAPKRPNSERNQILKDSETHFINKWGFSLFSPLSYFDDIKERYLGTEVFWRYNNKYRNKGSNKKKTV
jgi:GT2 family glycosyltransferase